VASNLPRRWLTGLLVLCAAAQLYAQLDPGSEQRLLVVGIDHMSGFGDAYISYMHTFGPEAFAVLGSPDGRPSVSASLFGKGRVLAAGHDVFFDFDRMAQVAQTNLDTFAVNSLRWLVFSENKKLVSKVTLIRNGWNSASDNSSASFRLKGLSIEVMNVSRFSAADLQAGSGRIAWISADATDEEQALVKAYVADGGAALAATPGWIFDGGLKHKGVQKLLWEFGLGLSSEGETWPGGLNPRDSAKPTWGPVLEFAQALKAPDATANLEALLAKQTKALDTIVSALRDLPELPQGVGKLAAVFGKAAKSFTPRAELDTTPTAGQLAAQFSLFLTDHSDANQLVQASATFPGSLLPGKTQITESLSLAVDFKAEDLSYLRQPYRDLDFWQSTGLYAPAGQPVTITVPPELEGLSVQVGSHSDTLSPKLLWARDPNVVLRSHLAVGTNTITSGFGGLIFLVPDKWGYRYRGELKVSGAVQAPWFQRGKTTLKEWKAMLATSVAPWGEIAGNQVIFTLPTAGLSKINPEVLTAAWDDNLSVYNALAGLTATAELPHRAPPNPQRYLKDLDISWGYMHSGYPIPFYDEGQLSNLADPKTQALWGFWHEMGHNYQQSWTWDGITEVTTNIFSLLMIKHWEVKNPWIIPADDNSHFPAVVASGIKTLSQGYFQRPTQKKDYNTSPELEDPFLKLGLFQQLMERYGTSWLTKLYREYRELPEDQLPQTEQQKIDYFVKASATLIGKKKEVLDLYDKWGLHYLAF